MIKRRSFLTMIGLSPIVAATSAKADSESDALRKAIGETFDRVKDEWEYALAEEITILQDGVREIEPPFNYVSGKLAIW